MRFFFFTKDPPPPITTPTENKFVGTPPPPAYWGKRQITNQNKGMVLTRCTCLQSSEEIDGQTDRQMARREIQTPNE